MRAAAALALAAGALVLAACGRADFSDPVGFADVEAALRGAGLEVCAAAETGDGPPGATDERRYDAARDCDDEDTAIVVVATAYEDAEDRDAAARRFEVQARPPAAGVLWTHGPLTVRVTGDRDPEAVNALIEALDERGAH